MVAVAYYVPVTFDICSSITGSSSTVINSDITHIRTVLTHRCQAKLPT